MIDDKRTALCDALRSLTGDWTTALRGLAETCAKLFPEWPPASSSEPSERPRIHQRALENLLSARGLQDPAGGVRLPPAPESLADEIVRGYTATHKIITYYAALNIRESELPEGAINFGPWQIRCLTKDEEKIFSADSHQLIRQYVWLASSCERTTAEIASLFPHVYSIDLSNLDQMRYDIRPPLFPDEYCEKCMLTLLLYPWECRLSAGCELWSPFRPPEFFSIHSDPFRPTYPIKALYRLTSWFDTTLTIDFLRIFPLV